MRVTHWSVLILVVTACAGTAWAQGGQPGGPLGKSPDDPAYALAGQYHCYNCHADTVNSPVPLSQVLQIRVLERPEAEIAQPFGLQVELRNPWVADTVEMVATLHIQNATSLGFSTGQDPTLDRVTRGILNVTYDGDGGLPLPHMVGDRTSDPLWIEAPSNVTDLRLRLVPDNDDPATAPDLDLLVWPPNHVENITPWHVAENATAGGTETFQVRGGKTIAELGVGAWKVQARMPSVTRSETDQVAAAAAPQPFRIILDAWANTTGETAQGFKVGSDLGAVAKDDRADGWIDASEMNSTTITWSLVATHPPGPEEEVTISVFVHHWYRIGHQKNDPDHGWYVESLTIPVAVTEDGKVTLAAAGSVAVAPTQNLAGFWVNIGQIVGYTTGFLLIASMLSGGLFGRGSRRVLNQLFGSARRRVAFHNALSYGLTAGALGHMVLFLLESMYHWTLGLIWGGLAILALVGLGVTGALQVPMIRRWNYGTWRWTHFALALAALLFSVAHLLLDGINFTEVQRWVGWQDPLAPEPPV